MEYYSDELAGVREKRESDINLHDCLGCHNGLELEESLEPAAIRCKKNIDQNKDCCELWRKVKELDKAMSDVQKEFNLFDIPCKTKGEHGKDGSDESSSSSESEEKKQNDKTNVKEEVDKDKDKETHENSNEKVHPDGPSTLNDEPVQTEYQENLPTTTPVNDKHNIYDEFEHSGDEPYDINVKVKVEHNNLDNKPMDYQNQYVERPTSRPIINQPIYYRDDEEPKLEQLFTDQQNTEIDNYKNPQVMKTQIVKEGAKQAELDPVLYSDLINYIDYKENAIDTDNSEEDFNEYDENPVDNTARLSQVDNNKTNITNLNTTTFTVDNNVRFNSSTIYTHQNYPTHDTTSEENHSHSNESHSHSIESHERHRIKTLLMNELMGKAAESTTDTAVNSLNNSSTNEAIPSTTVSTETDYDFLGNPADNNTVTTPNTTTAIPKVNTTEHNITTPSPTAISTDARKTAPIQIIDETLDDVEEVIDPLLLKSQELRPKSTENQKEIVTSDYFNAVNRINEQEMDLPSSETYTENKVIDFQTEPSEDKTKKHSYEDELSYGNSEYQFADNSKQSNKDYKIEVATKLNVIEEGNEYPHSGNKDINSNGQDTLSYDKDKNNDEDETTLRYSKSHHSSFMRTYSIAKHAENSDEDDIIFVPTEHTDITTDVDNHINIRTHTDSQEDRLSSNILDTLTSSGVSGGTDTETELAQNITEIHSTTTSAGEAISTDYVAITPFQTNNKTSTSSEETAEDTSSAVLRKTEDNVQSTVLMEDIDESNAFITVTSSSIDISLAQPMEDLSSTTTSSPERIAMEQSLISAPFNPDDMENSTSSSTTDISVKEAEESKAVKSKEAEEKINETNLMDVQEITEGSQSLTSMNQEQESQLLSPVESGTHKTNSTEESFRSGIQEKIQSRAQDGTGNNMRIVNQNPLADRFHSSGSSTASKGSFDNPFLPAFESSKASHQLTVNTNMMPMCFYGLPNQNTPALRQPGSVTFPANQDDGSPNLPSARYASVPGYDSNVSPFTSSHTAYGAFGYPQMYPNNPGQQAMYNYYYSMMAQKYPPSNYMNSPSAMTNPYYCTYVPSSSLQFPPVTSFSEYRRNSEKNFTLPEDPDDKTIPRESLESL